MERGWGRGGRGTLAAAGAAVLAWGLQALAGPDISNVQVSAVTDTSAVVSWTTSEPADSRVDFGLTTSLGNSVSEGTYVTDHSLVLTGLTGCRLTFFQVTSTGASGTTTDDNGGLYHTFTTQYRDAPLALDDVEGGVGSWEVVTRGAEGSEWQIDTCRAASGTHAWKAGEHDAPDCLLAAKPSSDTSLRHGLPLGEGEPAYTLTFKEWLDTADTGACRVRIFKDSAEDLLGPYGGNSSGWRQREVALSGYEGNVAVWFDFHNDGTDPAGEGWYIDDIEVSRLLPCGGRASAGAVTYADACTGAGSGGDRVLDPGETAEVKVQVANAGTMDATNVTATLSTSVPGVSISPASYPLGTLNPLNPLNNGTYKGEASFTVTLSRGLACGTAVDLQLVVQSDQNIDRKTLRFFVGATPPLWEEDFQEGLPVGWQALDLLSNNPPQTWVGASGEAPAGTADPYMILDSDGFGSDGTQDAVLVTPVIDGSAAESVELAFDTLFWSLEDGTDSAAVEVNGDGGTTWTEVSLWRTTVGVAPDDRPDPGTAAHVVLDLTPQLAGKSGGRIRFRYRGSWAWYWIVDNVAVTLRNGGSSCTTEVCCGTPAGLSAPEATDVGGVCADSGVQISWSADPATAWGDEGMDPLHRRYAVYRGAEAIATGIAYGTTAFTDTEGANNTAYDYQVKYLNTCGEEDLSPAVSGTDAYQPAAPTISGPSANTCPAASVVLATEAGMTGYQWRRDGEAVGTDSNTCEATQSGTYTVSYTNASGCWGTSLGHAVTLSPCAAAPVGDGRNGTQPLRLAKGTGGALTVTYDVSSCPGDQPRYNLLYGDLANVSTYGFTGSLCDVDAGGSTSWASPPSGNLFILLVSENGTLESSWGKKRTGGTESERSTAPSGLCGSTAVDTSSTCP